MRRRKLESGILDAGRPAEAGVHPAAMKVVPLAPTPPTPPEHEPEPNESNDLGPCLAQLAADIETGLAEKVTRPLVDLKDAIEQLDNDRLTEAADQVSSSIDTAAEKINRALYAVADAIREAGRGK
jgi:hypothetical protein